MLSTKRPSGFTITGSPPKQQRSLESDRTLVCAVKGIPGRICIVTIRADATVAELEKKVYEANAVDFSDISAAMLRVFSTKRFPGNEWARLGAIQEIAELPLKANLFWRDEAVGDHFPSDIPPVDSGVVHVQVQPVPFFTTPTPRDPRLSLPDDKPTSTNFEEEIERYNRVAEALDLLVIWEIKGTDFSAPHDFPSAQRLEYERYCGVERSRVFIGDKKTWRELFAACNEAVIRAEGRVGGRFIEGFEWVSNDTLEPLVGS